MQFPKDKVSALLHKKICLEREVGVCFDLIPRWIIFFLKSQLYTPGFHQHDGE